MQGEMSLSLSSSGSALSTGGWAGEETLSLTALKTPLSPSSPLPFTALANCAFSGVKENLKYVSVIFRRK